MKNSLLYSIRLCITLLAMLAFNGLTHAALYTAASSGNWSNPSTWGGTAPSFTLLVDQIVIPAGITVTLDNDLHLNGVPVSLTVMGTLNTTANNNFKASWGSIVGNGTMNMDNVEMDGATTLAFTGNFSAKTLTSSMTSLAVGADIDVSQSLILASGELKLQAGGSLKLETGADMVMSGGTIAVNGGSLLLTDPYNVNYTTVSAVAGLELSGTGLNNVLVNVQDGNNVSLANDLTVKGMLNLMSGTMKLNGYNLTIDGDITSESAGYLESDNNSDIYIKSTAGTTGAMNFEGTTNSVGKLTVQVGSGNKASLNGVLAVNDQLVLASGTLGFDDSKLWINGDLTGSGYLHANESSVLGINKAGGISTPLNFKAGGDQLEHLYVNVGPGSSVSLASGLTVKDSILLQNQSNLKLGAHTLTIGENGIFGGSGKMEVTNSSGLVVNATNGLTDPLALSGTTIGSLTVNTAAGKGILLNGDLTVASMLSLQKGNMDLNGKNLKITGNIAAGGTGYLKSDAGSNITINSATSTAGPLKFEGNANAVNKLTVDMGANQKAFVEGILAVDGELSLANGILVFDKSTLIINDKMTGTGKLSGGTEANLSITSSNAIPGSLTLAVGGQQMKNLVINTGTSENIKMGSAMTIEGDLDMSNGTVLAVGNHKLTIGANGNIKGIGSLGVDSTSSVVINADNGLAGVEFTGESLGYLAVNVPTNESVVIDNDLVISGKLYLQQGAMDLNGYDLTIKGDIEKGGYGTITSTDVSSITVKTAVAPEGSLSFSPWGYTVNTLSVDIASGGNLNLDSDLDISETLEFKKGKLYIENYELSMDSSAIIIGAGLNSYVIADTAGYLSMFVKAGASNQVLFPIGTESFYAPAQLSLTGNSKNGRLEANVLPNVWEEGSNGKDLSLTQPLVDATWKLSSDTAISNMNLTAQLMWTPVAEVNSFNRNKSYVSGYSGGKWDKVSSGAATSQGNGLYSMQRSGMTSLGQLAVFDESATTLVHNLAGDSQYIVYPNPATSNIFINNATTVNDIVKIDIINLNGQVVQSSELNNSVKAISLAGLNSGNYLIRFTGKDINEIKRFVKQ